MSQTITAIYADGVLRPLAPLNLPEQTQVEVEIKWINNAAAAEAGKQADSNGMSKDHLPSPRPTSAEERARIRQALIATGLVINRPPTPLPDPPLSEEERERLGRLLAVGGALSEIIIEERREGY